MFIFKKDYPYKLKILGCGILHKNDYDIESIFIKSHNKVYMIRHYCNKIANYHSLQFITELKKQEILDMDEAGICNEELILERLILEPGFDLYKVPFPGLAIVLYDKNNEIITNKFFSLQLSTSVLIPSLSNMEEVTSKKLLRHLEEQWTY